ncbi:hypothetical protein CPB83DRAFT_833635 [Crepidotus variabilis]|uniref:Transmembrane protein n=1 Tax=Crepidotus variabilis TaxID=179855 RepID=A0A9P6EME7_9AGAR|nr:hypothetical protein CPB83DRAFT_833635 [Crepidotus variabilis]
MPSQQGNAGKAARFHDAVADISHHIKEAHILLPQEGHCVAVLFLERQQGDQHIRTVHFMLAQPTTDGLHRDNSVTSIRYHWKAYFLKSSPLWWAVWVIIIVLFPLFKIIQNYIVSRK